MQHYRDPISKQLPSEILGHYVVYSYYHVQFFENFDSLSVVSNSFSHISVSFNVSHWLFWMWKKQHSSVFIGIISQGPFQDVKCYISGDCSSIDIIFHI